MADGNEFVPNVEEIGGRFQACVEFQPSQYGEGSWKVTVTDTQTGDIETSYVYEANAIQPTADRLARIIVADHDAELQGPKGWRFDIPGAEESSESDTTSYAEGESGSGA